MNRSKTQYPQTFLGPLIRYFLAYKNSLLRPSLAMLLALLVCGVIIQMMGYNPIDAYYALIESSFGSKSAIGTTIVKSLPLMIGGLAVTIAYRAKIFNIGIEGQIAIGGVFAAWATTTFTGLPSVIHIPLGLAAGIFGGMLYAYLPGWLKARWGVNEVIVTLLLNYVALQLVSWAVRGPLRAPGQLFAKSAKVVENAQLPILLPDYRLNPGIFIALALLVLGYLFLWHTAEGYNIRFVGANPRAAEAAGIKVPKTIILSMLISGGLGGFAGAIHLQGTEHRLLETFMAGYGYDSIATALVGQLHPVGVLFGAFFFGILRSGSFGMQISVGIPSTLIYIIQGITIVFILASQHIRLRDSWLKRKKETNLILSVGSTPDKI
jgi:general nucleoside transport system permease protein